MADSDETIIPLSSRRGRDAARAAARPGDADPVEQALPTVCPSTDDPMIALAYHHLSSKSRELLGRGEPGERAVTVESVHRMRLATRRLRAALRTFEDILPEESRNTLKSELKWLASVLGKVRDIDVYRENVERYAARIPAADQDALDRFRAYLKRERDAAEVEAEAAIRSNRLANLRVLLQAFLRMVAAGSPLPGADTPIDAGAQGLIDRDVEHVLELGNRIGADAPDSDLHALRIECKHLRYTLELLIDLYPKRLKRLLRRTLSLHDVLGDHQDACVASERLKRYAETVPAGVAGRAELLALGQLLCGQQLAAADSRTRFDDAWAGLLHDLRKHRHKLH